MLDRFFSLLVLVLWCVVFLLAIVLVIPIGCYMWIKDKFYSHRCFVPYDHKRNETIQPWLDDNIKYVWIEEICVASRDIYSSEDYLRLIGWDYRFICETDLVAFKIMWAEIL